MRQHSESAFDSQLPSRSGRSIALFTFALLLSTCFIPLVSAGGFFAVSFEISPVGCGTIKFDDAGTFSNGLTTNAFLGSYPIIFNQNPGYVFSYWSYQGGLWVSQPTSASTTVIVFGQGTLIGICQASTATTTTWTSSSNSKTTSSGTITNTFSSVQTQGTSSSTVVTLTNSTMTTITLPPTFSTATVTQTTTASSILTTATTIVTPSAVVIMSTTSTFSTATSIATLIQTTTVTAATTMTSISSHGITVLTQTLTIAFPVSTIVTLTQTTLYATISFAPALHADTITSSNLTSRSQNENLNVDMELWIVFATVLVVSLAVLLVRIRQSSC